MADLPPTLDPAVRRRIRVAQLLSSLQRIELLSFPIRRREVPDGVIRLDPRCAPTLRVWRVKAVVCVRLAYALVARPQSLRSQTLLLTVHGGPGVRVLLTRGHLWLQLHVFVLTCLSSLRVIHELGTVRGER